ncbi:hypothetical protein Q7C_2456 [Methylophaga frappieri]|uniref:Sn-glycerol-3-phosphate transporter n=1 Tax=Methylophaga frappieri (strain ATCC BAA-2434 / DSM 25690 / JAM7) TaxID=754477 RepID=I1YKY8_METFJ|nr:hypothetical protein [Methylophaga frappieri]AFJ03581.1 hypothetical protein Q7C_2456 [Methylophaga frappieri]
MLRLLLFVQIGLFASTGQAGGLIQPGDRLLAQTSVWTAHYDPESDHNNHQRLINLEYYFAPQTRPYQIDFGDWRDDLQWLAGAATFRNSFDQQSQYVYGGSRYDLPVSQFSNVYIKVTAGLLHGYRGEYQDKVPFNSLGIAPVILPAVGWQYRRANVELVPFGTAGMTMNVGWIFD